MPLSHLTPLKRRLVLALIIVCAAAAGVGAGFAAMAAIDKRPATIVKAAFDANEVTYRDGRIQLYFDVTRLQDCPSTTTRWLWTWVEYKGEQVRLFMPLGQSATGITDVGEEHYLLSLEVPKGVWDGTWYYYARDVTRCGGLSSLIRDRVSEIPSISINIKGTQTAAPPSIKPSVKPSKDVPMWRRAIIMDGKPLP